MYDCILKFKYGDSGYICNYCSIETNIKNHLSKCSKCKFTYYCNRECQINDWKIHKLGCNKNIKDTTKNQKSRASLIHRNITDMNNEIIEKLGFQKCYTVNIIGDNYNFNIIEKEYFITLMKQCIINNDMKDLLIKFNKDFNNAYICLEGYVIVIIFEE